MHAGSLDSNGQLTSVSKSVTAQLSFGTAAATQGDIHMTKQHKPALFTDMLEYTTVVHRATEVVGAHRQGQQPLT